MPDKVFAKAGSLDQLERVIPKVEIVGQLIPLIPKGADPVPLIECYSSLSVSSTAPLGESKGQT